MSNMHRIQWIDAQVRAARYPNARTVSERFEISQRQAARDIEYLRYSMGAPLAYSADKNGYFYEDNAFALPSMYLSADDKQTLSYLALQYRNLGSESAARLANLFNKLTGDEEESEPPETPIPALSVEGELARVYLELHKSIVRMNKVQIRYCSQKNEVSERVLCPYRLFSRLQVDYVVGFCELRQEIRVFRMDRIRRLRALSETFQISTEFKSADFNENILFRIAEPYTALIRFHESFNIDKLQLKAEPAEAGAYRIAFFDSSDILVELIKQPATFTIISPRWLKDRLVQRLQKLIDDHITG